MASEPAETQVADQLVVDLGTTAIKTVITLNAGAFIVLLTFVGNIAENAAYIIPIGSLRWSMSLFLAGIVFGFLAIFLTYVLAQMVGSKLKISLGFFWGVAVQILPVFLSVLAFVFAVLTALYGIKPT
ncbi:MAG: hypothetical protein AAGA63_09005 [Pseudomonadota bacterium]